MVQNKAFDMNFRMTQPRHFSTMKKELDLKVNLAPNEESKENQHRVANEKRVDLQTQFMPQESHAKMTRTCPVKVFLHSDNDRFYQRTMQIEGRYNLVFQAQTQEVNESQDGSPCETPETTERKVISHDLRACSISSIDT